MVFLYLVKIFMVAWQIFEFSPTCIVFIIALFLILSEEIYGFNPFSTGTHFYHKFWLLDGFVDIRKGLWRLED